MPHVHHGGARDVICVEGALAIGVCLGVVDPTAEPPVLAIGTRLGVCPEHTDRWIDIQLIGGVTFLFRGYNPIAKEIEVIEIGERVGLGESSGRRQPRHQEEADDYGNGSTSTVHGNPFPERSEV